MVSTPLTQRRQPPAHLVGAALRAAEDDRLLRLLALQQFHQQIELPLRIDGEIELLDRLDRQVLGREIDHLRLAHVALGQPLHRRRNRGAQQQRLPRLRAAPQNLLDVRPKADVEHPVGLVEHHDADVAQHQRAAADQVQHPAGRADDDLGPAAKMLDLLADRLAAVDAHDVDLSPGGEFAALVADLNGQLAGGHQDQRLRIGQFRPRLETFENRDAEGGGLARARLRLAHQVDAFQRAGNQPGLDGRGLEILGLVQRGKHDLGKPHAGEAGRR